MTMTVRDLIRSSLRLIGTYATGEVPDAAEEQDALNTLNDMIDTWSAHNLLIYDTQRVVFTTSDGVQVYTFGPTGDWITSTVNSMGSMSAFIDNVEIPLTEMTVIDWQNQPIKSTQSAFPTSYYIEKTFPNKTVSLWPVPAQSGQIVCYFKDAIPEFTSLDDTVSLPNGYRQALRYNLAILLAAEYGKQPDAVIVDTARTTFATIKRMNNDFDFMRSDFGVPTAGGSFNIYTGH